MTTIKTIGALVIIAITIILAASCVSRPAYKPFDAGVAIIKAKHSVDSMQRSVDARTVDYIKANGR